MQELGVNIDHVATLREARKGLDPEPVYAALICQNAGADSIVAHLREDRRHIKEKDLLLLKRAVGVKLNLEMSVAPEIVEFACKIKPDQATFVPEKRLELTTEGGLDVINNYKLVKKAVDKLSSCKIKVSLFIDPDIKQIEAAIKTGVKMIELHTGRYAEAKSVKDTNKYFAQIKKCAVFAKSRGLRVFAGHGLNYHNVRRIAGIKEIEELNIGHSIICRAVMIGLDKAVKEMIALIN